MPEENLILKKIIYAVEYEPLFSLVDSRGRLLSSIKESDLFEAIGIGSNGVDARETRNNRWITLTINTRKLSGLFEVDQLSPSNYNNYFRFITQLVTDLNITSFLRIGVRFFLLNEVETFESANNIFINKIDQRLRNLIGNNFVDSAIVPVVAEGNNKIRIAMGPIKNEEYSRYFILHDRINIPAALFYDCDFFVTTYQYRSFRLERFLVDAYENILGKVRRINQSLINELRVG